MTTELLTEIRDLLIEIKPLLHNLNSQRMSENFLLPATSDQGAGDLNWATYLDEKQTINDYEIVALVVDHLTRASGGQPVGKNEIVNFLHDHPNNIQNTKTIGGVIANTSHTALYGYIEFIKKDKGYKLTMAGKQLIQQLPNRPDSKSKPKTRRKKK